MEFPFAVGETLIAVDPLPDELAAAHVSRWMRALGSRSHEDLRAELSLGLQAKCGSEPDAPLLHCIARASGLEPLQYLRRHSMLGIEKVAIFTAKVLPTGSDSAGAQAGEALLRLPRKAAFFCPQCVSSDLANTSTSWYRREHQLPGAEWCTQHAGALLPVSIEQAFLQAPHDLIGREGLGEAFVTAEFSEHGFIRRFLDISKHLLQECEPVDCQRLHHLLGDRAILLRVSRTQGKGRRLLSDLILECAEERWLLRHFTQFIHKMPGKTFGQVDKILSQTLTPAEGGYYALSLAALFPSASEAIKLLGEARHQGAG